MFPLGSTLPQKPLQEATGNQRNLASSFQAGLYALFDDYKSQKVQTLFHLHFICCIFRAIHEGTRVEVSIFYCVSRVGAGVTMMSFIPCIFVLIE